jgi:hypothetical protein
VKAAKARRAQGLPPQPLEPHACMPVAADANTNTPPAEAAKENPKAGDPLKPPSPPPDAPEGTTPPNSAAMAMVTLLEMLPEGSKLGYKTVSGFFVPLNLHNLQVYHGVAEKFPDSSVVHPPAASGNHPSAFPVEMKTLLKSVFGARTKPWSVASSWSMCLRRRGWRSHPLCVFEKKTLTSSPLLKIKIQNSNRIHSPPKDSSCATSTNAACKRVGAIRKRREMCCHHLPVAGRCPTSFKHSGSAEAEALLG